MQWGVKRGVMFEVTYAITAVGCGSRRRETVIVGGHERVLTTTTWTNDAALLTRDS